MEPDLTTGKWLPGDRVLDQDHPGAYWELDAKHGQWMYHPSEEIERAITQTHYNGEYSPGCGAHK